uniref:Cysteine proteinase inhibitor n=1 Tax=Celosia cristata TaxID=124768 RepID=Q70VB0_9CARY|nr:cysteine proteinase inhibitor [Celosia cristata]
MSSSNNLAGGWFPVDPNSPKIQKLARWAVDEENKKPSAYKLEYKGTFKAEEQIVEARNSRISLEAVRVPFAASNKEWHKYQAIVYEDLNNNLELKEFKPLLQANDDECIAVAN